MLPGSSLNGDKKAQEFREKYYGNNQTSIAKSYSTGSVSGD